MKKTIVILILFLICGVPNALHAQIPFCEVCHKAISNCPYKGNHPKCPTCGKVKEDCPYNGKHPRKEPVRPKEPSCFMSLDALRIMYAGIENPVTIFAEGYDSQDLSLSVEPTGEAEITKGEGAGSFVVKPNPGVKKLTFYIIGGTVRLGSYRVIVKDIPAPILKVAGRESGGFISRKDLPASTRVVAIKDPNFLLDVDNRSIRIIKMLVHVGAKEETVNGERFNESIASMIKEATRGEKLEIQADVMMPDGKPKSVTWTATLR